MIVRCASPTCATAVTLPYLPARVWGPLLRRDGWVLDMLEHHDDRPRWYCPRCRP